MDHRISRAAYSIVNYLPLITQRNNLRYISIPGYSDKNTPDKIISLLSAELSHKRRALAQERQCSRGAISTAKCSDPVQNPFGGLMPAVVESQEMESEEAMWLVEFAWVLRSE